MTLEQRVDRAERILILMVNAGYRGRKEFREQARLLREEARLQKESSRESKEMIHMLIQAQMETSEQIKGLAVGHAILEKEMAKLAESTREILRSSRKRRNGKSD